MSKEKLLGHLLVSGFTLTLLSSHMKAWSPQGKGHMPAALHTYHPVSVAYVQHVVFFYSWQLRAKCYELICLWHKNSSSYPNIIVLVFSTYAGHLSQRY